MAHKLSHKLTQRLLITPQLKQAIRLLQLSYLELKNYVEQKIAENPLLQPCQENELKSGIERMLREPIPSSQNDKTIISNRDELPDFSEIQSQDTPTLETHLLHQLRMSLLNDDELRVGEEIIARLDENGYLRENIEALAADLKCSHVKIQKALKTIQTLEPYGVGAINLQDCLLIQLRNNEQEYSLAFRIVESYFKELARKNYGLLAKKLRVSLNAVEEAVKQITSLNPKPGAVFSCDKNIAITPDLIIERDKGRLKVSLNETGIPKLRINNHYKKLLQDPRTHDEVQKFIKNNIKNGLWLINARGQRKKNVIKVARQIVKIQKVAIVSGLSQTNPLTLKDIAVKTNLYISTVGRIVANKYALTPQGTIKLKEFFGTKYIARNGNIYSNKYLMAKIKHVLL